MPLSQDPRPPRNIILIIGDGMGLPQISSLALDSRVPSAFERFPVIGFQKTHSASDLITDSAAGATAMACGVKTYNGAIGLNTDTLPIPTLLERCETRGLSTGIATSVSLVHATPAAFAAHEVFRERYEQIAADFLDLEIDYMVGGGQKFFERRQTDDQDLCAVLRQNDYQVYSYFDQPLQQVSPSYRKNFLFFTADEHPVSAELGRSYLPYACRLGVNFLDKHDEKGFFFLVEGGQIDWAGHYNNPDMLAAEMADINRTILEALQFALMDGTTLVIVTADHATGGLGLPGSEKNPERIERRFTTNGHNPAMVPVFAFGPRAELFSGIFDNTQLHEKILQALEWEVQEKPISLQASE